MPFFVFIFDNTLNFYTMTDTELEELKKAITDAISTGFSTVENNNNNNNSPIFRNRLSDYEKLKLKVLRKRKDKTEKEKDTFKSLRTRHTKNVANTLEQINKLVSAGAPAVKAIFTDIPLAHKKSALQEQKNLFDKSQKIFEANMAMSTVVAENVATTITSFTTKLATEAARDLRQGAKQEAAARIKLARSTQMAEREFAVAETERKITEQKTVTEGSVSIVKGVGGIVSSVTAFFGPLGQAVGAVVNALTGMVSTVIETQSSMNIAQKEFSLEKIKQQNEVYDMLMGNVEQVVDKVKKIVDSIDNAADAVNDYIRETDTIYKNTGLMFGFVGDKFSSSMRKTAIETARIFGITAEEMKTMQESFINSSNRSLMLTGDNYNQMTAISKVFGISQGEVSDIMGTMNIFNVSAESGYNMFNNIYKTITKMGLSTAKFGKELNNNLKLAQKYNFKGGVENMMKMTKWSQQTRFNLNSATSLADTFIDGTLSDVLEKSARLQVLGGAAAMYSDPFGMLYDSGADVGNLAKRMAAMLSDITPTFKEDTGEFEFGFYGNKQIAAVARALGIDRGEAFNVARQNAKQGVINRILNGFGLDEDTLTALGNRAEYDTIEKKWKINTANGVMDIEDVANMGDKDRAAILLPDNEEDSLIEIAKNTRSMVELEEIAKKYFEAVTGSKLYSTAKEASEKNIETQQKLLNDSEYTKQLAASIKATADIAAAETQATLDFINNDAPVIAQYRNFVIEQINKISAISDNEKSILNSLQEGGVDNMSKLLGTISQILIEEDEDERKKLINDFREKNADNKAMRDMLAQFTGVSNTYGLDDVLRFNRRYYEIPQYLRAPYYEAINTDSEKLTGKEIGDQEISRYIPVGQYNNSQIHDGIVTNNGAVSVRTHPRDQYLAAMPNGPIDKILSQIIPGLQLLVSLFSGRNGLNNNMNVNLNGSLVVSDNGSTINLVELIKNNPSVMSSLIAMIHRIDETNNSGKPSRNYMV